MRRERAQEAFERFEIVMQEARDMDFYSFDPLPRPEQDAGKQAAQAEMASCGAGCPTNRLQVGGFGVSICELKGAVIDRAAVRQSVLFPVLFPALGTTPVPAAAGALRRRNRKSHPRGAPVPRGDRSPQAAPRPNQPCLGVYVRKGSLPPRLRLQGLRPVSSRVLRSIPQQHTNQPANVGRVVDIST